MLVICATIYEETLVAKGINLYGNDNVDVERKKEKASSIKNSKYEMNRMNNNNIISNNEPEYELSKVHLENDLHKLGECHSRLSVTNIIGKHVLCDTVENFNFIKKCL